MAVVAAMMSTVTMATTPPMMATVLSEAELAGFGAAAVCSDLVKQWIFYFYDTDNLLCTRTTRLAVQLRESSPC